MNKVFIDTDIILDLMMEREPFFYPSAKLFDLIENKKVEGYTSALVFSNLFYIIKKDSGRDKAIKLLRKLKMLLKVLSVNSKIIDLGLLSNFNDFEDSIQYYTAIENKLNILITRNTNDYKTSKINLYTADEFIKIFNDKERRDSR